MPATFSLMEHHASWSVLSVPSVVHSSVHLSTWSCPGPMLFVCDGFYDGHKPVVEPLAQPVFMLTDHTRTRQGQVARLLGALVRGISYLWWWGHDGNGFQPLPLTQCCFQARDWTSFAPSTPRIYKSCTLLDPEGEERTLTFVSRPNNAYQRLFLATLSSPSLSNLQVLVLNGTSRDRLGTPSIAGTVVNLILSSFHHEKFLLVITIIFRMV